MSPSRGNRREASYVCPIGGGSFVRRSAAWWEGSGWTSARQSASRRWKHGGRRYCDRTVTSASRGCRHDLGVLWLYGRLAMAMLAAYGPGLLCRRQAVSPEVQRGDYYDEDLARWDFEGLTSDLTLARSALKRASRERFEVEKAEAIEAAAAAAFQAEVQVDATETTGVASTTRSKDAGGTGGAV